MSLTVEQITELRETVKDYWCNDAEQLAIIEAALDMYFSTLGDARAEPDFDAWQEMAYTKVLMKSIKDDYVPRADLTAPPRSAAGYVLVPVEPTEAMWRAARDVMPEGHANIDEIWKAMLTASSPGAGGEDEVSGMALRMASDGTRADAQNAGREERPATVSESDWEIYTELKGRFEHGTPPASAPSASGAVGWPDITLEDGKYRFHIGAGGTLFCQRYGEPWRDFLGDKAVHALFDYAVSKPLAAAPGGGVGLAEEMAYELRRGELHMPDELYERLTAYLRGQPRKEQKCQD